MKRMLALLTVLLFCLPCAAQAQEAARGRYVQEAVDLPQGVLGVYCIDLDGQGRLSLLGLGENGLVLAALEADGSWVVKPTPWADQLDGFGGAINLHAAAIDGEDVCLAVYVPLDGGDYGYQLMWARGEQLTPIDNTQMLEDGSNLNRLRVGEGRLIVQGYGPGAYSYDGRSGSRLTGYPQADGDMQVEGGRLYALDTQQKSALALDLKSGDVILEMTGAPLEEANALFCDDQSLYLLNSGGVYRIALGGSMWEQLVEGELTDLRQSGAQARALCLVGEDIYALTGGQTPLLRFRYDAEIAALPTGTLSIYSLYPSLIVEQAASAFQMAYPDYQVRSTILLDSAAGVTRQDVTAALNVELLAGRGPDVLLLDGLPVKAYIEKGVLADLSPVIDPLLERGELMDNLFAPFRQDGRIYQAPSRAALPVALGDVPSGDWARLVQEVKDGLKLPARSRQGYAEMFLPVCFGAWFEEDGALREEALRSFLAGVETLYQACGAEGGLSEEYAAFYQAEALNQGMALVPMNGYLADSQELVELMAGRYEMLPIMLAGLSENLIELTQVEDMGWPIALLPGQAGDSCQLAGMVGVNARSREKEAAMAFAGIMLSRAVQDSDLYDGAMAVNRASLKALLDKEDMRGNIMSVTEYNPQTGESTVLVGRWPRPETRRRVYELLSGVNAVYVPDESLLTLIREALTPFYRGEMDPTQATQAVSAKLKAYLAE